MRSPKYFLFFLAAFVPFFAAGAITASLFDETKISLSELDSIPSRGSLQATVLLYKENNHSQNPSLPESIDLLIMNLGADANLHIIHIFPTHDDSSNILLLSDLALILQKDNPDVISYFENLKEISINGIVKYDNLAEKSIREIFPPYLENYSGEISDKKNPITLCEHVQTLQMLFAGNINIGSLYPKHINSSFDVSSRFLMKSLDILADGDFTCQSFE